MTFALTRFTENMIILSDGLEDVWQFFCSLERVCGISASELSVSLMDLFIVSIVSRRIQCFLTV